MSIQAKSRRINWGMKIMPKKKKSKKDYFDFKIVDKFDDDDLYDDCLICQAEKFRNKYDRYPSIPELIEFLKTNKTSKN